MSPFPLAGVLAPILGSGQSLDETIWADFDTTTAGWEDEVGNTTNLHDSVNSENDSLYVILSSWILNTTERIVFGLEDPSGEPTPNQSVEVFVRAEYLENFEVLPTAPTMTIRFDENGTQRATSSALSLTKSPADYSFFLNTTQINSVTDWNDVEMDILFDNTANTGVDEEAKFQIYEVRTIFTP